MEYFECEHCDNKYVTGADRDAHQQSCCEAPDLGADETTDQARASSSPSSTPARRDGPLATNATGTVSTYHEDGGYGFAVTADVTTRDGGGVDDTASVFFHITDLQAESVSEGDRLRFDVVEDEEGLCVRRPTVIDRAGDDDTGPRGRASSQRRHGFGHQKDDTKYGPGKDGPTESDIEDFRDDRKFR